MAPAQSPAPTNTCPETPYKGPGHCPHPCHCGHTAASWSQKHGVIPRSPPTHEHGLCVQHRPAPNMATLGTLPTPHPQPRSGPCMPTATQAPQPITPSVPSPHSAGPRSPTVQARGVTRTEHGVMVPSLRVHPRHPVRPPSLWGPALVALWGQAGTPCSTPTCPALQRLLPDAFPVPRLVRPKAPGLLRPPAPLAPLHSRPTRGRRRRPRLSAPGWCISGLTHAHMGRPGPRALGAGHRTPTARWRPRDTPAARLTSRSFQTLLENAGPPCRRGCGRRSAGNAQQRPPPRSLQCG